MSTLEYEYRIFVLDTSFLLDHPDFDDFDYGVNACTLMIPNRVQQEITKKRNDPQKGRSARELDRKFMEWTRRGGLRQGLQVNNRVMVRTMPDPVQKDYPELAFHDRSTGYDDIIIAAAKEVAKKYPQAIVKLVTRDNNQFARAETNDVEAADETVLESDRFYRLARDSIEKDKHVLARVQLRKAVKLYQKNLDAILWLASVHLQAGEKELVAQDLEKANKLGLKRADQYCHLAEIYRDLGDPEKAAEALEKAEELGAEPQHLWEGWKELGWMLEMWADLAAEPADDCEMAIAAYRKAFAFIPPVKTIESVHDRYHPGHGPAMDLLALLDLDMEEVDVEKEKAQLLNRIGQAYMLQGKLDEAVESYLEALRHQDNAETHYLLGLAYKAKAMSEFEQILADEKWQHHAKRELVEPLKPSAVEGGVVIPSEIRLVDLAKDLNEDARTMRAAAREIIEAGGPEVSKQDMWTDREGYTWVKANVASLVAAKFGILTIEE